MVLTLYLLLTLFSVDDKQTDPDNFVQEVSKVQGIRAKYERLLGLYLTQVHEGAQGMVQLRLWQGLGSRAMARDLYRMTEDMVRHDAVSGLRTEDRRGP